MTQTNIAEKNEENEQFTLLQHLPRHPRLQSFIEQYGVERTHPSAIDRMKQFIARQCSTLNLLCCVNALLERIPLIRCLKDYRVRQYLFGDIIAGITVAIMHIPQGKHSRTRADRHARTVTISRHGLWCSHHAAACSR
jgi:hypothetical protein